MDFEYSFQITERGNVHVFTSDGRKASLITSTALAKNERFAAFITPLDAALASTGEKLNARAVDGYTGAALDREKQTAAALVAPLFHAAIDETRKVRENHAVRMAKAVQWDRSVEPNAPLRSDLRNWFLGHDMPNRIKIALESDFNVAVAIYEGGQVMSGLDDKIWTEFMNHFMALNHIKRTGLDAGYLMQSSVDFLTAAGTDHKAVMVAANAAVKALHYDAQLLDDAEHYLRTVMAALMLLTDKSASELLGNGA